MREDRRNEINNVQLKEHLGNTALSLLVEGVDYSDLAGLTLTFGYLFEIPRRGLEALFKVITDRGTAYFAVQKGDLMRVDLTDGMYDLFVEMYG